VTDTARSTILIKTNAEKYSFGSFPSEIRFTAAPPNPPSPIRLKIPKYARNRKYEPRGAGPNAWAKYIVERNPTMVSAIVEKSVIRLCRWIELIFIRREIKRE
jgi:hypothetical protein